MSWARVDDGLHAHRKVEAAGFEAMGLWVLALSWCSQQLTDGFIPRHVARRFVGGSGPRLEAVAARLVAAGLWSPAADYPAEYPRPTPPSTPTSTPPSTSGGNPGGNSPPCVGWVFHDYLAYHSPRYRVLEERAAKSAAARNTNERRWGSRPTASLERPSTGIAPATPPASLQRVAVLSSHPIPSHTQERETAELTLVPPEPKQAKSGKRAKTYVPESSTAAGDVDAWCTANGVPSPSRNVEAAKMLDHFRGKGEAKLDWGAVWRNWERRASEFASTARHAITRAEEDGARSPSRARLAPPPIPVRGGHHG